MLTPAEWAFASKQLEERQSIHDTYSRARRDSFLGRMYLDAWVGWMLTEVPQNKHGPILELMCGEAEISRRLPVHFTSGAALDLNVKMVERAARDLAAQDERRVRLVCGTAEHLPFRDGEFEIVMIQGGLHHVRSILDGVLREIARVMRPGAVLIASEPANDFFATRAIRRWQYRRSALQGDDPDEDGFTRKEVQQLLAQHGLRLDGYRQFGFLAYPLMGNTDLLPLLARSRSRWLGGILLGIDRMLSWVPLVRSMAWASIFRATKP